jgi:DNA-binding NtrC family response regulator
MATFGGEWRKARMRSGSTNAADDPLAAKTALDDAMKSAIARSLNAARGDCAKAAQSLGISRPAIYRKMARYGLTARGKSQSRQERAISRPETVIVSLQTGRRNALYRL